jgi:hypothetical protein
MGACPSHAELSSLNVAQARPVQHAGGPSRRRRRSCKGGVEQNGLTLATVTEWGRWIQCKNFCGCRMPREKAPATLVERGYPPGYQQGYSPFQQPSFLLLSFFLPPRPVSATPGIINDPVSQEIRAERRNAPTKYGVTQTSKLTRELDH